MIKKLFFVFASTILFFSCVSQEASCILNSDDRESYLPGKWEGGSEIYITGEVECINIENNSVSYAICENCQSRSRVSFYVREEGSDSFAYDSLKNFVGDFVSVKAVLLEDSSPWSKVIILTEVIVEE